MTSLHVAASSAPGISTVYAGRWLRLERLRLAARAGHELRAPAGDECVVVLLRGDVVWNGTAARRSSSFGQRASAVYLPPGSVLAVSAASESELLVATSRFGDVDGRQGGGEPVFVGPNEVTVQVRGREMWEREVHDVAVDQVPARHLMVGETFNVSGGWSSFPPHKHDGAHGEPELEEAYSFRFDPPEGFGFQAVERAGEPQAFVVRDGDTVGIPAGYHPVCAAPGYRLAYCWVLSGPVRRLEMVEDPRYSWLHTPGSGVSRSV
jgi:5-deoxy-glucuronate isomerase